MDLNEFVAIIQHQLLKNIWYYVLHSTKMLLPLYQKGRVENGKWRVGEPVFPLAIPH